MEVAHVQSSEMKVSFIHNCTERVHNHAMNFADRRNNETKVSTTNNCSFYLCLHYDKNFTCSKSCDESSLHISKTLRVSTIKNRLIQQEGEERCLHLQSFDRGCLFP